MFFWKGTWELSLHVWNGLYFALFVNLYLGLECCIQNPFPLEPYKFAPQSSSVLWVKDKANANLIFVFFI